MEEEEVRQGEGQDVEPDLPVVDLQQPSAQDERPDPYANVPHDELLEMLHQREGEKQELIDRLQRSMAEFDNYTKRVAKEREELQARAAEGVICALLEVLDNFDRALEHSASEGDPEAIMQGIQRVRGHMMETLAKNGLEPMDARGKAFDPGFHEAMFQVPTDEVDEDTVVEVVQKGYLLNGRLLRAARVGVAKPSDGAGPRTARQSEGSGTDEGLCSRDESRNDVEES